MLGPATVPWLAHGRSGGSGPTFHRLAVRSSQSYQTGPITTVLYCFRKRHQSPDYRQSHWKLISHRAVSQVTVPWTFYFKASVNIYRTSVFTLPQIFSLRKKNCIFARTHITKSSYFSSLSKAFHRFLPGLRNVNLYPTKHSTFQKLNR